MLCLFDGKLIWLEERFENDAFSG